MLSQLRSHWNPDHDKFSSTVVAIFPNVFLWRRSLCSNLAMILKNSIEPPSYASTAYVAIWPLFLFNSSVKIWDTCENFLGKWFTAPRLPGKKFPVRLWMKSRDKGNEGTPLRYAVSESKYSNELLFLDYRKFRFWIGGEERYKKKDFIWVSMYLSRNFTWSSEPREGPAACRAKEVPSFLSYF